ncbi:hypothetical protein CEXT_685681 [Caerostris extrusa]|uniref:Uncharacterized protein n=1 Tax=Caerostris extrusa TaxID=172846 RepID=A0AAV4WV28_CAEEX|nr:hypothetical protein CEXT_685681 [Caerostris extrusa]
MTNNGILPLFGQCVPFHGCYRIVRNRQLDEDGWKRASRAVKFGLALRGWGMAMTIQMRAITLQWSDYGEEHKPQMHITHLFQ